MSGEMILLLMYLAIAVGVSFLCSLCEAALLTLTPTDAASLQKRNPRVGARLVAMKETIDRPLAAILTLNTISHTVGAAGVGAQAAEVFNGWVGVTSAVLTLLILVFSEIIPKTIGAVHARRLAVPTVWVIQWMIWVSYPVVVPLEILGRLFKGGGHGGVPTREEIQITAEMARMGGSLNLAESKVIQNLLRLRETKVREVMTPRTVVFMLDADAKVGDVLEETPKLVFSRIPLMGEGSDDLKGMVLRTDILQAAAGGRGDTVLSDLKRTLSVVPETAGLMSVMDRFRDTGDHLFVVVDEYGGTAGVVTLEDVIETILGSEIVDETDLAVDMQRLAREGRVDDAETGESD